MLIIITAERLLHLALNNFQVASSKCHTHKCWCTPNTESILVYGLSDCSLVVNTLERDNWCTDLHYYDVGWIRVLYRQFSKFAAKFYCLCQYMWSSSIFYWKMLLLPFKQFCLVVIFQHTRIKRARWSLTAHKPPTARGTSIWLWAIFMVSFDGKSWLNRRTYSRFICVLHASCDM